MRLNIFNNFLSSLQSVASFPTRYHVKFLLKINGHTLVAFFISREKNKSGLNREIPPLKLPDNLAYKAGYFADKSPGDSILKGGKMR
jgi:hypothetical protein